MSPSRVLHSGSNFELVETQGPQGRVAVLKLSSRPPVTHPFEGARWLIDLAPLPEEVALALVVELADLLRDAHSVQPPKPHLPIAPGLLALFEDGSVRCFGFGVADGGSPPVHEDAAALARTLGALSTENAMGVAELLSSLARTAERRPDFAGIGARARALLGARAGLEPRSVLVAFASGSKPKKPKLLDFELAPVEPLPEDLVRRPQTLLVSEEGSPTPHAKPIAPDRNPTVSSRDPGITFTGSTDERSRERVHDVAPQDVEEEEDALGLVLHGYRLDEVLGSGTFANVYRGRHLYLAREAAVKVLRGRFAASEIARRRMMREADALSRLDHPNVVAVRDFGLTPGGLPFMIMELLHGRTLKALLRAESPLSPDRVASLTRQLVRGLHAVHSIGLVHRDLKPSNILVYDPNGIETLKILDFGVVRRVDAGHETQLTRARDLIGTPKYMAPEQIGAASEAGPEADLYAAGTILYEMLSGQAPFLGPTKEEVLEQHRNVSPAPLATSGPLGRVALELLSKRPEDRIRSSEALLLAIDQAIGLGEPPELTKTKSPGMTELPMMPTVTVIDPEAPPATRAAALLPTESTSVRVSTSRSYAPVVTAVCAGVAFVAGVMWSPRAQEPPPVAAEVIIEEPQQLIAPVAAVPSAPPAPPSPEPTEAIEEVKAAPSEGDEEKSRGGRPKKASKTLRTKSTLEARYRSILEKKGITSEDLRHLVDAKLIEAWHNARNGDVEAAEGALDALSSAIDRAALDKRFFEKRLVILRAKIRDVADFAPREDLDAFDDTYRELKKRALEAGDASVLREIAELEKRLQSVKR
ncbi:MAG: serine/threonine protein kinase [Deltaproteobacteria bacterium]|nr:serine/threonine protein kinase [Deltaproteobacteria bacterium]